ncbi:MAG: 23S rRNA (pseudouridine(1915)-N(3))-methyltransferase RlmH [Acidobacteriota bacterium]
MPGTDAAARLLFLAVGETTAEYARVGEREYLGRIGRYLSHRTVVVAQQRQDSRYSAEHRVEREGRALLERIADLEPLHLVALDAGGKHMTSGQFANLVRREATEGTTPLGFVIGGPDGLSYEVRGRADRLLALSRMTLPHDMARLLLLEQVYRALSMIHGHPYAR